MPVPCSLDGFDVDAAVERMLGNPELWWQAVGIFVEHFAGWEQLWQLSIGDDFLERKQVHAIRSAAANVGAVQLAASAGELEAVLLTRIAGGTLEISDVLRERLRDSFQKAWAAAVSAISTRGQCCPEGRN